MTEVWTGKGSRHRTPDMDKYGSNFDRLFPNRFIPSWDKQAIAAREVYRAEQADKAAAAAMQVEP